MAIIVGDIHGNVEKVMAFLAYRPHQEHIALGDYVDSFYEPSKRQLEALRLLLKSDAVLLWGNHDLHYLKTPPWYCSGYQWHTEWPSKFQKLLTRHKSRFKAAYAADGWLCTHAGMSESLQKGNIDVCAIADDLNAAFAAWSRKPVSYQTPSGDLTNPRDSIFNIAESRGGSGGHGGIFWFDFKREGGLAPVKQIFGHTETQEPVVTDSYVTLDTTNTLNACWVFDTSTGELVRLAPPMPSIEDLPDDEQGPFSDFLIGSSAPFVGGYWPWDYKRWKGSRG